MKFFFFLSYFKINFDDENSQHMSCVQNMIHEIHIPEV